MGSIFSNILRTASEPTPIVSIDGDIACCNCEESSSDDETPKKRTMALKTEGG